MNNQPTQPLINPIPSTEYPYPQPETPLTKICSKVAYFALCVMLWTAFTSIYGIPLTTWRVMNILFLIACVPFYKNILQLKEIKILVVLQAILVCGLLARSVFSPPSGRWGVELSQIIAVILALAVAPAVSALWLYNHKKVMNTITISMLISIAYQIFQLITYYAGGRDEYWPLILIDTKVLGIINFFRVVGPFYGASGFMHESGHLALQLGPQLCLLLIVWHYKRLINKNSLIIATTLIISTLLTLSFGGFMQLAIVFLTYLALIPHIALIPVRLYKALVTIILAALLIYIINPQFLYAIIDHVLGRTDEMVSGESGRQIGGSEYLWELFWTKPLFGFGLSLTFDELMADPNVLIPLTYVTHGAIVGSLLPILYFVPILRVLFVYQKPLFLIPIFALGVHASMAYGTYRWPSLWITYSLAICYASTFNLAPSPTPPPLAPQNPNTPNSPPPAPQPRTTPLRRREDSLPEPPSP